MKRLQDRPVVIGTRQSLKHITAGKAEMVILAEDTDQKIANEIRSACAENHVAIRISPSKKELGRACGIARDAAVVTVLKA